MGGWIWSAEVASTPTAPGAGKEAGKGPPPLSLAPFPAHLAQQAAFEVGAAAAWVRDEAPGIRRRRPGQRLQFGSRHGTRRRPGPGGGRGWSSRTLEGARGQDASRGLHADRESQRGSGLLAVPPHPGRAWRCPDLLRWARARGSPAFLSMNACPSWRLVIASPPPSWPRVAGKPQPSPGLTSSGSSSSHPPRLGAQPPAHVLKTQPHCQSPCGFHREVAVVPPSLPSRPSDWAPISFPVLRGLC